MSTNLIPIQITLQAASAADAKQLVQDLAGTMSGTTQQPKQHTAPVSAAVPVAPPQQPVQTPTAPATAPTAPPTQQQTQAPASPAQAPQPPAAPVAPTATPQYDFNQLATATMQLQEGGHNIHEILSQFGVQALNQLPKERYGEYAALLRQRGAKI